jgi:hypothetical protein
MEARLLQQQQQQQQALQQQQQAFQQQQQDQMRQQMLFQQAQQLQAERHLMHQQARQQPMQMSHHQQHLVVPGIGVMPGSVAWGGDVVGQQPVLHSDSRHMMHQQQQARQQPMQMQSHPQLSQQQQQHLVAPGIGALQGAGTWGAVDALGQQSLLQPHPQQMPVGRPGAGWGGLGRHFELEDDGEDEAPNAGASVGHCAVEPFKGGHLAQSNTILGGGFGVDDAAVNGLLFMDMFKSAGADAHVDIESIAMMGLDPE